MEGIQSQEQIATDTRKVTYLAFRYFVYALLLMWIAYVAAHHEPWRDEADVWLASRDASLWQIVKGASYSGTPFLWYACVLPLSRLGLPYASLEVLSVLLGAITIWIILFRLSLPLVIAILTAFGYHISYEYSVVARNYSLGAALLFATFSFDAHRDSKSLRYGILVALLANVSAHFLFIAVAFLVSWVVGRPLERRRSVGVSAAIVGILLSIAQLYPRTGGQYDPELFERCNPDVTYFVLQSFFGIPFWPEMESMLAIVLIGLVLLSSLRTPRVLIFLSVSLLGLWYIFDCKHFSGTRHSGLAYLTLIGSLAMIPSSPRSSLQIFHKAGKVNVVVVWITWSALSLGQIVSLHAAIDAGRKEIRLPYSSSKQIGEYLAGPIFDSFMIAGHPAPHTSPILPYLSKPRFFYPGIEALGSYMLWDKAYSIGRWIPNAEAFMRAQKFFSTQSHEGEGARFLFVTNTPFAEARQFGYELMFKTSDRPIQGDEKYYLYGPSSKTPTP